MHIALIIIGILTIIISIVAGLFTGSFWGFLVCVTIGSSIAMILFSFVHIIDNLRSIRYQLQLQNELTKKIHEKTKTCSNCDYEYDDTLKSCPRCGHRMKAI